MYTDRDKISPLRPKSVQLVQDNYDILHNEDVKRKYPHLYAEVLEHDKVSTSSWYYFTHVAYKEYKAYLSDFTIPYIRVARR